MAALATAFKGAPPGRLRSGFIHRVNRHITHGHLWSTSYFAASYG